MPPDSIVNQTKGPPQVTNLQAEKWWLTTVGSWPISYGPKETENPSLRGMVRKQDQSRESQTKYLNHKMSRIYRIISNQIDCLIDGWWSKIWNGIVYLYINIAFRFCNWAIESYITAIQNISNQIISGKSWGLDQWSTVSLWSGVANPFRILRGGRTNNKSQCPESHN